MSELLNEIEEKGNPTKKQEFAQKYVNEEFFLGNRYILMSIIYAFLNINGGFEYSKIYLYLLDRLKELKILNIYLEKLPCSKKQYELIEQLIELKEKKFTIDFNQEHGLLPLQPQLYYANHRNFEILEYNYYNYFQIPDSFYKNIKINYFKNNLKQFTIKKSRIDDGIINYIPASLTKYFLSIQNSDLECNFNKFIDANKIELLNVKYTIRNINLGVEMPNIVRFTAKDINMEYETYFPIPILVVSPPLLTYVHLENIKLGPVNITSDKLLNLQIINREVGDINLNIKCSNLKYLKLGKIRFNPSILDSCLKYLSELDIYQCQFKDAPLNLENFQQLNNLKIADIFPSLQSDYDIIGLDKLLEKFNNLENIEIYSAKLKAIGKNDEELRKGIERFINNPCESFMMIKNREGQNHKISEIYEELLEAI